MKSMWHDGLEWAERLRPEDQVDVGVVEQEVLDRASLTLYRHERLKGVWAPWLPHTAKNSIVVLLSGLAPIFGGLAFAGDVQFRNIQSQGVSAGIAIQVVLVCFLIGTACQIMAFASWWRIGRRTREADLMASGLLLVGAVLTLVFAAVSGEVGVGDPHLWPTWTALVAAVVSVPAFWFANSATALPKIDISRLTDVESQILLVQRNSALKEAAKHKAVRLRTVNKAIKRPLGALIGTGRTEK